jgi:hypothetical protein
VRRSQLLVSRHSVAGLRLPRERCARENSPSHIWSDPDRTPDGFGNRNAFSDATDHVEGCWSNRAGGHSVRNPARPVTPRVPLEEVATDDDLAHTRSSLITLLGDRETMAMLYRAAERYARAPRGALVARELVADVVGEMYEGTLKRSARHTAIASQVLAEMHRRAKRTRRRSKDDVTIDGLHDRARPSTETTTESSDPRGVVDLRRLLAQAREDVGEDPYARQLIALYELGFVDKRTIVRLGLPAGVYKATRARVMSALRARAQRAESELEHAAEHAVYRSRDPERTISALIALRRFGGQSAEGDRGGGSADLPPRRAAAPRKP